MEFFLKKRLNLKKATVLVLSINRLFTALEKKLIITNTLVFFQGNDQNISDKLDPGQPPIKSFRSLNQEGDGPFSEPAANGEYPL